MNAANERLLRDFVAAFADGDVAALRDLVAPDLDDHTLPSGAPPGIDGLLFAVAAYREAFPDIRISVEQVVSDADRVVGYGRITGTNTGSFFGMPPTGRPADFAYIDVYRFENGRITESWHLEDIAGMLRQLG
jgi:steroid delta-isomerase-like uncharacterized protein